MSTKIYNGYKLPVMSLKEIQDWVRPLRKQVKEEVSRIYGRLRILNAVTMLDDATVMNEERFLKEHHLDKLSEYDSPLYLTSERIQKDVDSPFSTGLNLDVEIVFFGLEDATLLMFFGGDLIESKTFFEALPNLEDYHYYDGSDSGELEFGKDVWKKRKKDWNEALKDSYSPIEAGLSIRLNKGIPFNRDEDSALKEIPTLRERATRLAKRQLEREQSVLLSEKFGERYYEIAVAYKAYLDSEEGLMDLESKTSLMEEKLIPEIDLQTLRTKLLPLFDKENK